jgi:hypothetical protein
MTFKVIIRPPQSPGTLRLQAFQEAQRECLINPLPVHIPFLPSFMPCKSQAIRV